MDVLTEMLTINLMERQRRREFGLPVSDNAHPPIDADGLPCRCGQRVVLGGITWWHR